MPDLIYKPESHKKINEKCKMQNAKNMGRRNLILEKTFDFSLKVVEIYKYLIYDKKEYVMSKQLLRSATSIGQMR